MTITLLDQIRAFDHKYALSTGTTSLVKPTAESSPNSTGNNSRADLKESPSLNLSGTSSNSSLSIPLSTYTIVHDEWTETGYLGMNILTTVISSVDIEICAQAAAKINTVLHNRPIQSCEEACYLISKVEQVMFERLNEGKIILSIIIKVNLKVNQFV